MMVRHLRRENSGLSGVASWATLAIVVPLLALAQEQPNPCFRWSGQMAIAGENRLYYYGGQARTQQDQTQGTWTNALSAIDLSRDWPTGTPAISLVQADNGNFSSPPAVALGALWASNDGSTLYQYGGQFSDSPDVPPPRQQIFQYSIAQNAWSTVATNGDTLTRAAEGAAAIVPAQGTGGDNIGYYYSGHLDSHTVQGWSNQVRRVYLNSLVQFDMGSKATRNITTYSNTGVSSNESTPQSAPVYHADGTLTYVPRLGTDQKGLLVAIGGATETAYVDNAVLDVYDIGANGWTKQSTLGDIMGSRLNHCAVRASAKVHGTEYHQIIVYGGQQLNQSMRDSAIYILTIPSFTWTFIGDSLPGQPVGRAGHQCALSGSQLIVVGGVVATNIICETPGVFVYDVSKSAWQNQFTASSQYTTPALVANITGGIGSGNSSSGAGSAAGGDGSSDPDTSGNTDGGSTSPPPGTPGSDNNSSDAGGSKTNIGAIVGGVVGGVVGLGLLGLLVLLLARRRKRQRAAAAAANGGRIESSGSDEPAAFPYEKTTPNSGDNSNGRSSNEGPRYAADDVEDQTRNMEAAFGSHLVPKRTLRVTNPGDE